MRSAQEVERKYFCKASGKVAEDYIGAKYVVEGFKELIFISL